MRASPLWLLALVPWVTEPPAHAPVVPAPSVPSTLAFEVQVRAPLDAGTLEFSVMTGHVECVRAPYGVTFCWAASPTGCDGLEVRMRVLVGEETPTRPARPAGAL